MSNFRLHLILSAVVLALDLAAVPVGKPLPTALAASHSARAGHVSHHRTMVRRFGIFPVLGVSSSAVRGTVYASLRGPYSQLDVRISGFMPMSVHAIHIHAGSCASPHGGVHHYILGFLRTGRSGTGTVQGMGPLPYFPGNRYDIVYAGTEPSTIIGCANLGLLQHA